MPTISYYQLQFLEDLRAVATAEEEDMLDAILVRSGYHWRCECGWVNWWPWCEACRAHKSKTVGEPTDESA